MPTSWDVDNETVAGVNSRFTEVTESDILRMQDITIPNDTKKATKLGMKAFRDKQCFNTQFAHMSSVFCPDRQPPLMNNNCHSTAPFQSVGWAKLRFGAKKRKCGDLYTRCTRLSFKTVGIVTIDCNFVFFKISNAFRD